MEQPAYEARKSFHAALLNSILRIDATRVPSNAGMGSRVSPNLVIGIARRIGVEAIGARLAGQMSGNEFEEICRKFLENTFLRLDHLQVHAMFF